MAGCDIFLPAVTEPFLIEKTHFGVAAADICCLVCTTRIDYNDFICKIEALQAVCDIFLFVAGYDGGRYLHTFDVTIHQNNCDTIPRTGRYPPQSGSPA